MTTAQELFEAAARGLHAQGKKSVDKKGSCLYRGPDGLKCGVGLLITDEEYKPEMDKPDVSLPPLEQSTGVFSIRRRGLLPKRLEQHTDLLVAIQDAHDEYTADEDIDFWPFVKDQLFDVAAEFGIDSSFLEDLK